MWEQHRREVAISVVPIVIVILVANWQLACDEMTDVIRAWSVVAPPQLYCPDKTN